MLLIKNGMIKPMAGADIAHGCILVQNGKIKSVAQRIEPASECKILDAQGCWVMTGIIEANCHNGNTEEKMGMEGNDCNETMQPITPYLRAIDAVNPMDSAFFNAVRAGITSVMVGPGSSNVVGGQFLFMKTSGRNIDDMAILAPAAMKVAFGENPKTNYSSMNAVPSTRMSVAALLRQELADATAYRTKKENAQKNGDTFEPDFTKECWLPVLERHIPLKAHVHRADDIQTAIRISKEFHLDMTLDHCTEGHLIASHIKASGFPAIVGPSIASRNKIEVRNMDFKTAGLLHKAGITVAITTDHPVSLIQYLPICAGLAAREGLGVEEGLRAITINAAKICRTDHRVGSLEPGKDADIAIFDGNPMEVFTKTRYTLINGTIVYDAARDKNTAEK